MIALGAFCRDADRRCQAIYDSAPMNAQRRRDRRLEYEVRIQTDGRESPILTVELVVHSEDSYADNTNDCSDDSS